MLKDHHSSLKTAYERSLKKLWRPALSLFIAGFMLALYLYRPYEGWPRLVLFIVGAACVPLRGWGIVLLIMLTPSLETLTLKYGFANQFIFENAWLGYALATFACSTQLSKQSSWRYLLPHPFVLPILALIAFTTSKWIWQGMELLDYSYEGISKTKLFGFFARNYWQWNETANPIHDLSIAIGSFVLICGLWAVGVRINKPRQLYVTLLTGLLLSAVPVHFLGYLHKYHGLVKMRIARDFGGAFQNGNVYSFYSGLQIILALLALTEVKNKLLRLLLVGSLCASSLGLLLGKGRTSWAGLAITLAATVLLAAMSMLAGRIKRPSWKQTFILGVIAMAAVVTLLWGWEAFRLHRFHGLREMERLVDNFSLRRLLSMGGRYRHFVSAWKLSQEFPWTGVGFGYFLSKSKFPIGIHNIYLSWIVGCGWWIILPAVFGIGLYFRRLWWVWQRRNPMLALASFALFLFIFLGNSFDHYIDYRPIAMICLISLALVLVRYPPPIVRKSWFWGILALAIVMGGLTWTSPHSWVKAGQAWQWESDPSLASGRYRWSGPYTNLKLLSGQCVAIDIRPVKPGGTSQLRFRLSSAVPGRFANLTEYESFMKDSQSVVLHNGVWQTLCVCHRSQDEAATQLSLFSNHADYLSIARHDFPVDDRFIAFGLSDYRYSDGEASTQECSQTVEVE